MNADTREKVDYYWGLTLATSPLWLGGIILGIGIGWVIWG